MTDKILIETSDFHSNSSITQKIRRNIAVRFVLYLFESERFEIGFGKSFRRIHSRCPPHSHSIVPGGFDVTS